MPTDAQRAARDRADREERLRLARKAFPGDQFEVWSDGQVHRATKPWSAPAACFAPGGNLELARRAELAALRVLAGEE